MSKQGVSSPALAALPDAVLGTLGARIAALDPEAGGGGIDPDEGLLDAGYVDSLTAAQLLAWVEEAYGVHVSVDRLVGDLSTLRALASWVAVRARRAP
jgi:acyl carrier protein